MCRLGIRCMEDGKLVLLFKVIANLSPDLTFGLALMFSPIEQTSVLSQLLFTELDSYLLLHRPITASCADLEHQFRDDLPVSDSRSVPLLNDCSFTKNTDHIPESVQDKRKRSAHQKPSPHKGQLQADRSITKPVHTRLARFVLGYPGPTQTAYLASRRFPFEILVFF